MAFCGAGAPGTDTPLSSGNAYPTAGPVDARAADEKYHPARNYQLDTKLSAREW